MDLRDLEHNTRDGVHIASLAGAWVALVGGFGGLRHWAGQVSFAPRLPEGLNRLAFSLMLRGQRLRVEVTQASARYLLADGDPLKILHHGTALTLKAGQAPRPADRPRAHAPPSQPASRPRTRPPPPDPWHRLTPEPGQPPEITSPCSRARLMMRPICLPSCPRPCPARRPLCPPARTLVPAWAQLTELLDFRQLVEQLIARTAAVRRDDADVAAIREAVAKYSSAADRDASRLADQALHQAIASAAHNARLAELRPDPAGGELRLRRRALHAGGSAARRAPSGTRRGDHRRRPRARGQPGRQALLTDRGNAL